ncbi:hypothetical protein EX30DRAFT_255186 [Ascodesmis nigricans]|uniref:Uncharacterized protein n=1 Tax=Ascodesmis nigricans TaxID=341454 RepID=A0A4S2MYC4_9PEZI|nr:hypothetical protein EX30DRAFT_255186 [Ascodesmis nigricans]
MSHPHRSVPPLASITLPSPPPQHSPMNLGQLPPSWQQSEEMMRTWFQAKMEEDRREQERERTRQEHQRTETRRIELDMLREALSHGVPPSMVPLMFIGPGTHAASSEWMQQYISHNLGGFAQQPDHGLQGQRQIQQLPSESSSHPTLRRETRSIQGIAQTSNSGPQQMPPPPPTNSQQPYVSTYQLPGTGNLAGPSGQRQVAQPAPPPAPPPPRTNLPRLNTANEIQFQQVQPSMPHNIVQVGPPAPLSRGSSQSHAPHPAEQSSSLLFHHWVPPVTQHSGSGAKDSGSGSGGGGGGTDGSPQRQLDSPFTHHPPSNPVTSSDYSNSPKKRKSTAAQGQQPPPPTSQPFSPQAHTTSSPVITPNRSTRRAHGRHRSIETGPRAYENQRLTRVHRRSVGANDAPDVSSQNSGSHSQPQPPYQAPIEEQRRESMSAGNTSSHYHPPPLPPPGQEHQRQQSVPSRPPSPPPPRPFSAGSEFRERRLPFPPPPNPSLSRPTPDNREEDLRDRK